MDEGPFVEEFSTRVDAAAFGEVASENGSTTPDSVVAMNTVVAVSRDATADREPDIDGAATADEAVEIDKGPDPPRTFEDRVEDYRQTLLELAASHFSMPCSERWVSLGPLEHNVFAPDPIYPLYVSGESYVAYPETCAELINIVADDEQRRVRGFCCIQNISMEWAIVLGVSWNLDPMFFIENLKTQRELGLVEVRGSCELRVSRYNPKWIAWRNTHADLPWETVLGTITRPKSPGRTSRQGTTQLQSYDSYAYDTSLSHYRVGEYLGT